MTSWDIGERLTSCGLGSEQRRLNRRILLKQTKASGREYNIETILVQGGICIERLGSLRISQARGVFLKGSIITAL
jgi:hypothetical protein